MHLKQSLELFFKDPTNIHTKQLAVDWASAAVEKLHERTI